MRVLTDTGSLPAFRNPVVTVGSYDGVHRGHRCLLDTMKERARSLGGETVVVTFAGHPRLALNSEDGLRLLTTLEEKAWLLGRYGIDNLLVMPFDEAVGRLSPEEFVGDFLTGKTGVRELVVGYNHRFGRERQGDAAALRRLGEKYGFGVTEVARFGGADKISSTAIRELIEKGDIAYAAELLGHPYIIIARAGENGSFVPGDPLKLLPPAGEYRVTADGAAAVLRIVRDGSMALDGRPLPRAGERVLISF